MLNVKEKLECDKAFEQWWEANGRLGNITIKNYEVIAKMAFQAGWEAQRNKELPVVVCDHFGQDGRVCYHCGQLLT